MDGADDPADMDAQANLAKMEAAFPRQREKIAAVIAAIEIIKGQRGDDSLKARMTSKSLQR